MTRNRRELLKTCLQALRAQTRAADAILVVDNASDDGTDRMLAEDFGDITLIRLETNVGGAGGFYEGIKAAYERGFDWLWVLDDDTEPTETALETLLDAGRLAARRHRAAAVLASHVLWNDDSPHPMNQPKARRLETEEMVALSEAGLLAEAILPIRQASFVSILISRDAVAAHGLPSRHFFLWNDDVEYTGRILRHERGYLVLSSVVYHRTELPYTVWETTGSRFYFEIRNKLFMVRGQSFSRFEKVEFARDLVAKTRLYLAGNRYSRRALATVARGVRDGFGPITGADG